jgi:hypothetical protein
MVWVIVAIFSAVVLSLAKMLQIIGEYIDESMEEIGGIDGIDEEEIM